VESTKAILKKYWGFDNFRPLQEEIVDTIVYGKDVLALLPTGGGKSVCFQVPGLALEGITLVISPLIALMDDQVKQLTNRGIRAKAITSSLSYREIDILLDNAKYGGIDFLYVSPERLQSRLFQERFKQMTLGLIVVDEAHCISEWGHDFRPSYKHISFLRSFHPNVPVIALTATANQRVKEDIIQSLELRQPEVFEAPFERNNISYEVYHVSNKQEAIVKWCLKNVSAVGIVYCQSRKSVKDITKLLRARGIAAEMYHGGMNLKERTSSLTNWMSEKTPVMVATNAFGMGIDKPNVRYVLHYEIPNNPEAYFQEAGRAGRDGLPSRTFAFIEPNDLNLLAERVVAQFPSLEQVKLVYRAMCNYLKIAIGSGEQESYPIDIIDFVKKFKLDTTEVFAALKLLEMNETILFSETGLRGSRVKMAIDNKHLYAFQLRNASYDPLITMICRFHSGVFDEFVELHEYELCKHLKIQESELERQLKYLEEHGILDITWRTDKPMVTFLSERLPDDYIQLKADVYHFRKERAFDRLEVMKQFVNTKHCRPQFIIQYFGQESELCGKCDFCQEQQLLEKHPRLELELIALLETGSMTLNEITKHFDPIYAPQVKLILQELLTQERIRFKHPKFSLPN
jgi:ATP-dependent DNA helicase RecQ